MIPNGEGHEPKSKQRWHYLAIKTLSALLRGITPKHHGDFCCLHYLHSFAAENNCESHKKVCENKYFCNILMSSEDTKILVPFINYAALECLIEKIDGCKNDPENSFATKVGKQIPSGFSMSTI